MNYRPIFVVTLFLSATIATSAALADPPSWAASRHHEKKMHKEYKIHRHDDRHDDENEEHGYYRPVNHPSNQQYWGGYDTRYSTRYGANSYGINQGRCNYSQLARTTNAGVGDIAGALGNAISNTVGGGNPLMGAIAGAVVSQMLGVRAGQNMDPGDRFCFSQSLEYGYDQRPITWTNQNTNAHYQIVPLRSFQNANGNWCREFNYQFMQNGQLQGNATKIACRMADGNWQ